MNLWSLIVVAWRNAVRVLGLELSLFLRATFFLPKYVKRPLKNEDLINPFQGRTLERHVLTLIKV